LLWTFIGILAACLTMFAFLPQVIKIIQTKSVKDISPLALFQFLLGVFFWLIYGIHLGDYIIILANGVSVLIFTIALILYVKYK